MSDVRRDCSYERLTNCTDQSLPEYQTIKNVVLIQASHEPKNKSPERRRKPKAADEYRQTERTGKEHKFSAYLIGQPREIECCGRFSSV